MRKKLILFLEIAVALAALVAGYIFVAGRMAIALPAVAGSATSPNNPHILYLAPEGFERGLVNDAVMQARGATPVRSWEAVRTAAASRPIDGLLIDATFIETINDTDKVWLQSQFRNGVVIIGLGVEDDPLAQALGLKRLRPPEDSDKPIGPTGYRMISSLVLAQPDDAEKLEQADWLNRAISEGMTGKPPVDLEHPATTSFRRARGELTSDEELDGLFFRLQSNIEGNHQAREDYQKELENSEVK